jgi:hypothetical protein
VLARNNPGVECEIRICAFLPALYTEIMGHFTGHRLGVVNDLMIVPASHNAGPASDAAI